MSFSKLLAWWVWLISFKPRIKDFSICLISLSVAIIEYWLLVKLKPYLLLCLAQYNSLSYFIEFDGISFSEVKFIFPFPEGFNLFFKIWCFCLKSFEIIYRIFLLCVLVKSFGKVCRVWKLHLWLKSNINL